MNAASLLLIGCLGSGLALASAGCGSNDDRPTPPATLADADAFPETRLSVGVDADHSLLILETRRAEHGALEVAVTGWGIEEYGLFLLEQSREVALSLQVMGFCGTVVQRTWVRRTFTRVVSVEEERALIEIRAQSQQSELALARNPR